MVVVLVGYSAAFLRSYSVFAVTTHRTVRRPCGMLCFRNTSLKTEPQRIKNRPLILRDESVAHRRFRDDEFRLGRIVFDLFAQVRDMNAEIMCLLDGFC